MIFSKETTQRNIDQAVTKEDRTNAGDALYINVLGFFVFFVRPSGFDLTLHSYPQVKSSIIHVSFYFLLVVVSVFVRSTLSLIHTRIRSSISTPL